MTKNILTLKRLSQYIHHTRAHTHTPICKMLKKKYLKEKTIPLHIELYVYFTKSIPQRNFKHVDIYFSVFSDSNFLDCLPQVLSAWQLFVRHFILRKSLQVLEWIAIWAVPGPFLHNILFFLLELSSCLWLTTKSAILNEDSAAVNINM